jgi:WD40 repeat protein
MSIAFSPDGRWLASASYDQSIRLWDTQSGAELTTLNGHSKKVQYVAFSPDGKLLASGSNDSTVILWDVLATLKQ